MGYAEPKAPLGQTRALYRFLSLFRAGYGGERSSPPGFNVEPLLSPEVELHP